MEPPQPPVDSAELTKPRNSALRNALLAITALNQGTKLLDYANVLVQNDHKTMHSPRIISGGCGGQELDNAELVGKGLLTAAIFGQAEEAPSARLILRVILELSLDHQDGIIFIIPASSASFNFGLAVEYAKSKCMRVRMLCVDDMLPPPDNVESSGCALLCKIAGAMAASNCSYDEIWEFCNNVNHAIYTIPLVVKQSADFSTNNDVTLWEVIVNLEPDNDPVGHVIVFNVSKELSKLSVYNLVKKLIEKFHDLQLSIVRFYIRCFLLTSADHFSLTITKAVDPNLLHYLDYSCSATGWPQCFQSVSALTLNNEIPTNLVKAGQDKITQKGPKLSDNAAHSLYIAVEFACNALISCERQLNIIDAQTSKGDVGTRLRRACEHINKRLAKGRISKNCPYAFLKSLSVIIESSVGGTMSAIYGMLFEAAAETFATVPEECDVTADIWLQALHRGIDVIEKYYSDRCCRLYTVHNFKMCINTVHKEMENNENIAVCLNVAVSAAEEAAQDTALPGQKYPDAGAHAVGIWMRAIFEGVKLTYCE